MGPVCSATQCGHLSGRVLHLQRSWNSFCVCVCELAASQVAEVAISSLFNSTCRGVVLCSRLGHALRQMVLMIACPVRHSGSWKGFCRICRAACRYICGHLGGYTTSMHGYARSLYVWRAKAFLLFGFRAEAHSVHTAAVVLPHQP